MGRELGYEGVTTKTRGWVTKMGRATNRRQDGGSKRAEGGIGDGGDGKGDILHGSHAQLGDGGSHFGRDLKMLGVGGGTQQVQMRKPKLARGVSGNHTMHMAAIGAVGGARRAQQGNHRWTPGAVPVWGGRGAVSRHPRVHPARILHFKLD